MTKFALLLIVFLAFYVCHGQTNFEKGYFITNQGERIECLIKNLDWENNPEGFKYKLNRGSDNQKAVIDSVLEFGIYNRSVYKRFVVDIDRSRPELTELSNQRRAIFQKEILFLKALIEGDANLYFYKDDNIRRYFYQFGQTDAVQLVHKSYLNPEGKVGTNNRFRQQLFTSPLGECIPPEKVDNIPYKRDELLAVFKEYNKKNGSTKYDVTSNTKKELFHISIRPGLQTSQLRVKNSMNEFKYAEFEANSSVNIGVETEFILPFRNNKWSVILEPSYQRFKSKALIPYTYQAQVEQVSVDFQSIDALVGLRHYWYLNNSNKLFANAGWVYPIYKKGQMLFERSRDLDLYSICNVVLGVGGTINNRYTVELRYASDREILSRYVTWRSNFQCVSVVFGCRII
ncbi:hypothetical protein ACUNWD_14455 [Sunxiuqinia sp. A32]|uniref:hypothetical protein n=1 Tax=Sunxiuqinia sp. A32 TaxID=3461496 RepID=UPI004045D297